VTANGWRTTSHNTVKLASSPLKHPCGIITGRVHCKCPLSEAEQTWLFALPMSAFDPKRTWDSPAAPRIWYESCGEERAVLAAGYFLRRFRPDLASNFLAAAAAASE